MSNLSIIINLHNLNISETLKKLASQIFLFFQTYSIEIEKNINMFLGIFLTVISILVFLSNWTYNRLIDRKIPEYFVIEHKFKRDIIYFIVNSIIFITLLIISSFLNAKNIGLIMKFVLIFYLIFIILYYLKNYKPEKIIKKIVLNKKTKEEDIQRMMEDFVRYYERDLFSYLTSTLFSYKDGEYILKCLQNWNDNVFKEENLENLKTNKQWYLKIILSDFFKNYKKFENTEQIENIIEVIFEMSFYYIANTQNYSLLSFINFEVSKKNDQKIITKFTKFLLGYNKIFINKDKNFIYIEKFYELIMRLSLKFRKIILSNEEIQKFLISLIVDFIFNLYLKKDKHALSEYLGEEENNIFLMIIKNVRYDENKNNILENLNHTNFVKKIIYSIFLLGGYIKNHSNHFLNEDINHLLNKLVQTLDKIFIYFNNNYSLFVSITNEKEFSDFKNFINNHLGNYFILPEKPIYGMVYGGFLELDSKIIKNFLDYYVTNSHFGNLILENFNNF
ncbi:MAG: hypothetical protein JG780_1343 [Thermosipho sp. (in: Bacteria)]|nr:hypothetical protein [Thermosipho sp. (in: thermotogales)]